MNAQNLASYILRLALIFLLPTAAIAAPPGTIVFESVCAGCAVTSPVYESTLTSVFGEGSDGIGEVATWAGGAQLFLEISNTRSGACGAFPIIGPGGVLAWICIDGAPCKLDLEWSINVGPSGGSAFGVVNVRDEGDPNDPNKNVRLREEWSGAGTGDSGSGELSFFCHSVASFFLSVSPTGGTSHSVSATISCTQCVQ